jgi:hypothetical protein
MIHRLSACGCGLVVESISSQGTYLEDIRRFEFVIERSDEFPREQQDERLVATLCSSLEVPTPLVILP